MDNPQRRLLLTCSFFLQEYELGNVKTEKKYNLSSGTASRIKNGKMYRDFYEKYAQ